MMLVLQFLLLRLIFNKLNTKKGKLRRTTDWTKFVVFNLVNKMWLWRDIEKVVIDRKKLKKKMIFYFRFFKYCDHVHNKAYLSNSEIIQFIHWLQIFLASKIWPMITDSHFSIQTVFCLSLDTFISFIFNHT